ncbi:MAG: ABC transporter ATP-binding protein [Oceanospirillaceae bacterium]|nr:ABC transporter ATP-binding protein [Oceanospirillaceae bacterium]
MPNRLFTQQLSVAYADKIIIENLDLKIVTGKTSIIIGANGCGKSTLLKTIARVLKPQSGCVILDGQDIAKTKTKQVAQKLGLLPQGPVTPEGLTVKELVSQGRYPHQSFLRQWSRADEEAVCQAMQICDVAALADALIDNLSGGQRQRCWIAMVLAQQTDFILLDEPTTFLDLKVQIDLMRLLVKLVNENNRTLVMVLHDLNLAAAFADRLIMLKAGQVLHHGPVDQVFCAENIKQIFDLDVEIMLDPRSQRPLCLPHLHLPTTPHFVQAV